MPSGAFYSDAAPRRAPAAAMAASGTCLRICTWRAPAPRRRFRRRRQRARPLAESSSPAGSAASPPTPLVAWLTACGIPEKVECQDLRPAVEAGAGDVDALEMLVGIKAVFGKTAFSACTHKDRSRVCNALDRF